MRTVVTEQEIAPPLGDPEHTRTHEQVKDKYGTWQDVKDANETWDDVYRKNGGE